MSLPPFCFNSGQRHLVGRILNAKCTVTTSHASIYTMLWYLKAVVDLWLYKTNSGPYQTASPIPHSRRPMMTPIALHPRKGVLDMFRPQC